MNTHNEASIDTETAAVAETGAPVAPKAATSKKTTSAKKGAAKGAEGRQENRRASFQKRTPPELSSPTRNADGRQCEIGSLTSAWSQSLTLSDVACPSG